MKSEFKNNERYELVLLQPLGMYPQIIVETSLYVT